MSKMSTKPDVTSGDTSARLECLAILSASLQLRRSADASDWAMAKSGAITIAPRKQLQMAESDARKGCRLTIRRCYGQLESLFRRSSAQRL
jgi:hypothetical protein